MPILLLALLLAAVDGINLLQMAGHHNPNDLFSTFVTRRTRGVLERCKGLGCRGRRGDWSDHNKSNQSIK